MDYAYQPQDPSGRYRGLAIVAALHLLLAWALISGTARKGLEILKKPLEAVVIQEVFIPPPPPPPPPPKEIKPPEAKAPKVEAPTPPPFVPPPEVPAPATAAPAITSTPTPPAAPPVIAPPPPPAPPAPVVAAPAPAAPAPAPPVAKAPAKPDVAVDCPTQVKPEYPRKAQQDGIQGVVKVQALIKDGVVKEVTFLSGPRALYAAVRSAMLQYKCSADPPEYLVTQEFPFKIE